MPAVVTTGTGEMEARLNNAATALDYTLSYEDLEGADTFFAHIHLGQEDVNGGVIAFLCGGGGKDPCPDVSGTVTESITAADVIGPAGQGIAAGEFGDLLGALRRGAVYANVHTDKHPSGEIRGQLK
ncbi:MAG: CHRD domain-containing protein [Thermoanaerobaculia bacterium]